MTSTEIVPRNQAVSLNASKLPNNGEFNSQIDPPKRFGFIMLFVVFFFFGGWAALAPIDGAAVAAGTVNVRSYSKFVQHLEGGIIEQIFVDDGEEVVQGQPILALDSTQSKAQLDIADSQYIALTARDSDSLLSVKIQNRLFFQKTSLQGGKLRKRKCLLRHKYSKREGL